MLTISVGVRARLIEALDAARAAEHVLGLMSVERVRGKLVFTLCHQHTQQLGCLLLGLYTDV